MCRDIGAVLARKIKTFGKICLVPPRLGETDVIAPVEAKLSDRCGLPQVVSIKPS